MKGMKARSGKSVDDSLWGDYSVPQSRDGTGLTLRMQQHGRDESD